MNYSLKDIPTELCNADFKIMSVMCNGTSNTGLPLKSTSSLSGYGDIPSPSVDSGYV